MTNPNLVVLYVDNTAASSAFYADLFERQPVQSAPNFAMFALDSGMMLGLWAKSAVQPLPIGSAGSAELVVNVGDRDAVTALHNDWAARGLAIAQRPTDMDFAYTFVALDRDGHRLRVMAARPQ